jgi:transmembrane sensor
MKTMEKITFLIEKFWQGTASREEKQQLFELLQQHSGEWENFLQNRFANDLSSSSSSISSEQAAAILRQLHNSIGDNKTSVKRIFMMRSLKWTAAAAIIFLVAGTAIFQLNRKEVMVDTATVAAVNIEQRHVVSITNHEKQPKIIHLEDGSMIKLYAHGSVSYNAPFDSTDRSVQLTGNAYFKVAKSNRFPFAVTSGNYTTTALGTEFEVNLLPNQSVNVKLFEGKVVVESLPESDYRIAGTYLKPGQQLTIDVLAHKHLLAKIPSSEKSIRDKNAVKEISNGQKLQSMDFHKTGLNDIIAFIEQKNNVTIQYNEADLKGLTFTGSFSAAENYKTVLSIICSMNDLTLSEQDGILMIQKSQ